MQTGGGEEKRKRRRRGGEEEEEEKEKRRRRRGQWPDCNSVLEAIFAKLCALYPNAVHCDGVRLLWFTMVARTYKYIQECIITNAKVEPSTTANTAGEAKLKGRLQPQAISQAPPPHHALPVIAPAPPITLPFILPYLQLPTVSGPSQVMYFSLLTFSFATINSDTDIHSSSSLYHSTIQEEKTGEGVHWYCHKKVCEEDRHDP
ncbi:uncharacterized protein AKAME5_002710700 [Lates japonicus]|uniref:Uncharacterized protein n=1 Tax=Lates japonicus TaxID=270547 RepID=A0AAD3M3X7_LATJO|nr:uncharacterized protein AKAME5_002710700 [Lates japonicus]